MLKKDNWWLGIGLGAALPAIFYVLILFILRQAGTTPAGDYLLKPSTAMLLALFSNFIVFRYYMVNLKYDLTGRGILLVTFLYAGVFFYLFL
jgi:hypothetical protein